MADQRSLKSAEPVPIREAKTGNSPMPAQRPLFPAGRQDDVLAPAGATVQAVDWLALREAFLDKIAAKSGSMKSRLEYDYQLRRFFSLHPDPLATTPLQVHAFGYRVGRRGAAPASSTIHGRLSIISSFFEWLIKMDVAKDNPALRIDRPRLTKQPPRVLDEAEIGQLMRAIPDTPEGSVYRAMIWTSLYTGLRRQSVAMLVASQLRRRGEEWTYRVRVKGGDTIEGELPPPALQPILESLKAHGRILERLRPGERIFARWWRGNLVPVSPHTYWQRVRELGEKIGIEGLRCHSLRHASAVMQRKSGAEIEEVSGFLHHSSPAVTVTYLRSMVPKRAGRWREVQERLKGKAI